MMVRKQRTAPKLTQSLVIDDTNDKKAPGTLLLGDCGCLPGPPIFKNLLTTPISLHPIRVGGKPTFLGNFSSRTPIVPPVSLPQDTPLMTD